MPTKAVHPKAKKKTPVIMAGAVIKLCLRGKHPRIYCVGQELVVDALTQMLRMPRQGRAGLGQAGAKRKVKIKVYSTSAGRDPKTGNFNAEIVINISGRTWSR